MIYVYKDLFVHFPYANHAEIIDKSLIRGKTIRELPLTYV